MQMSVLVLREAVPMADLGIVLPQLTAWPSLLFLTHALDLNWNLN